MVSDTKPEYIGCYSLDELQSQPIKSSEVIHDNSPKHCGLWCRARGYTNFLLYDLAPHGITCRCANTLTFKKKRPESECDVAKCPGDLSKGCGSQQRTRVFQFKEEGIQKWQKVPLPLKSHVTPHLSMPSLFCRQRARLWCQQITKDEMSKRAAKEIKETSR